MRSGLVLIFALFVAAAAAAAPTKGVPQLIFPVVGTVQYSDDFGAPRAGGPHQGIDILADKRDPAVAAEAGTIKFWTTSATAGCMLYLYGVSGTTYLYIHLNNDLTLGNDNKGKCVPGTAYAPGLKDGAKVAAGQLVGYVGDSGDANGIHPHLHFEVHPNDGAAVDPFPYLKKAKPLIFSAKPGTPVSLSVGGTIAWSVSGALALNADQVRTNAGAPVALDRSIVFSLASNAQASLALPPVPLGLDALLAGQAATIYTQTAKTTLAIQRGDPRALTAARIVVSP
jgi:hypothetical protein